MFNDDKTREPPLTDAYEDLVRTVEFLSGKKFQEEDLSKLKESFKQMKEREAQDVAREIAASNKKAYLDYAEHLYSEGIVDKRWTFNTLLRDPNNLQAITSAEIFCKETSANKPFNSFAKPKLFLVFGKEGTGKSVLVHAMANEYLRIGVKSLELTTFEDVLKACYFQPDELRQERIERYEEWDHYCQVKILILDGVGQVTDGFNLFEQKVFAKLVRTRATYKLPLIITTSLPSDQLSTAIGTYPYESLKEYEGLCVGLLGNSRRAPLTFNGRILR